MDSNLDHWQTGGRGRIQGILPPQDLDKHIVHGIPSCPIVRSAPEPRGILDQIGVVPGGDDLRKARLGDPIERGAITVYMLDSLAFNHTGRSRSARSESRAPGRSPPPILEQHKLADPWNSSLVFPGDDGKLMSPDVRLRNVMWDACDRCKLHRIRVHDLRHVFASYFVMRGGDIFTRST